MPAIKNFWCEEGFSINSCTRFLQERKMMVLRCKKGERETFKIKKFKISGKR
jgi:hypothetical protein